jgi:hypothetical protein
MRKNCARVIECYRQRKPSIPSMRGSSIWTDGVTIYSYSTPILASLPPGTLILNRSGYSITTTIHQNALAVAFPDAIAVTGLERGISLGRFLTAGLRVCVELEKGDREEEGRKG